MLHEDITEKIIGAAFKVHSALGNGFQEVVYQRALKVEFTNTDLTFEREKDMTIYYYGHEVGSRRVDFFVEGLVMVELKALIKLEDVHLSQVLNYLEAYHVKVGLLLNFGAKSLEFKRVHNNKI